MRKKHEPTLDAQFDGGEALAQGNVEGPFDDKPAPPGVGLMLSGPVAAAYERFRTAAQNLEGKHKAWQDAQEGYRVALAEFTRLAVSA